MPKASCLIVALAATLLFALPSAGAAKPGGKSLDRLAAQACAQERQRIGKSAFRKKYGERATNRVCVRRTRNRVKAALRNASDECLAELAQIGAPEFAEYYGSDASGSDAFVQCVDETAEFLLDPEIDDSGDDLELEEWGRLCPRHPAGLPKLLGAPA